MIGFSEYLSFAMKMRKKEESLQRLMTRLYVTESTRKELHIEIDHHSNIFENIQRKSGIDHILIAIVFFYHRCTLVRLININL